jgi:hypothetical protein
MLVFEILQNPASPNSMPGEHFFATPEATPIDESDFYKREWLPILRAAKIRPPPLFTTQGIATLASCIQSEQVRVLFQSKQATV